MRKIPIDISLFDNVYGNDIPCEQYFVLLFDTLPSKHSSKKYYSKELVKYLKDDLNFITESKLVTGRRYLEQNEEVLFINKEKKIMVQTQQNPQKSGEMISIVFFYDIKNGEIHNQLDFERIISFGIIPKKSNIQLVRADMGQLDTEEYNLSIPECNLELNYGKEFAELHKTIVRRLNTPNDKGIILFHGDPGTGKTTYIKILTKLITDKDILFIPPSMAEMLSEPSIIPFLMDHRNSILLIEDAECVIGDREGKGSPAGVSNILNLTDGILGDCLNIQVIATFNMSRERIDKALLRKGRLICEHRFDKLNITDTNILLTHLGKKVESKTPLSLADIYNIDTDLSRVTATESAPMGFNRQ